MKETEQNEKRKTTKTKTDGEFSTTETKARYVELIILNLTNYTSSVT